jgi:hypothetical protein
LESTYSTWSGFMTHATTSCTHTQNFDPSVMGVLASTDAHGS